MIELKLEPYCQHCGSFEAETRHQVLFSDEDVYEDMTTIVCENAPKCAKLYDYIQRRMICQDSQIREKCMPLNGNDTFAT